MDPNTKDTPPENRKKYSTLILIVLFMAGVFFWFRKGNIPEAQPVITRDSVATQDTLPYFTSFKYNPDSIKDTVLRGFVEYGKELIDHTPEYIGPDVKNAAMRFAGNNLTCGNCHLNSGTRPYSGPFIGVWGSYPNFRKRENTIGTLYERLNGCMERSMNGKKLPPDSKEMKAMLAYIQFINKEVPVREKIEGMGFVTLKSPKRAADIQKGKAVYQENCQNCHGENGEGLKRGDEAGYLYPPLWGGDSFNDGAGMHRLLTAAKFIKGNMPYGTPVGEPTLTDEQAYDVAAYINSFPRPVLKGKEKDYPDLTLKPVDCPYPPYADTLSAEQHRLGPYVFN